MKQILKEIIKKTSDGKYNFNTQSMNSNQSVILTDNYETTSNYKDCIILSKTK